MSRPSDAWHTFPLHSNTGAPNSNFRWSTSAIASRRRRPIRQSRAPTSDASNYSLIPGYRFTFITSSDGSRFRLEVINYQFPDQVPRTPRDWDANWLVAVIDARGPVGSWTAKGPHVLTWELEKLVKWLDAASRETPTFDKFRFTEPYLAFEMRKRSEDIVELRVLFVSYFRPPWNDGTAGPEILSLNITPPRLREAASDLGAKLQRFPGR